jgi:hypothetical protein
MILWVPRQIKTVGPRFNHAASSGSTSATDGTGRIMGPHAVRCLGMTARGNSISGRFATRTFCPGSGLNISVSNVMTSAPNSRLTWAPTSRTLRAVRA